MPACALGAAARPCQTPNPPTCCLPALLCPAGVPRNAVHYTTLMSTLQRAGQWERSLSVYRDMARAGVQPDVVARNAAMTACGKVRGVQGERRTAQRSAAQRRGRERAAVVVYLHAAPWDRAWGRRLCQAAAALRWVVLELVSRPFDSWRRPPIHSPAGLGLGEGLGDFCGHETVRSAADCGQLQRAPLCV